MTTPTTAPLLCQNPDHTRSTAAVARLTYPDGGFNETAVCKSDLGWIVRQALDYGHPVLVSPVRRAS